MNTKKKSVKNKQMFSLKRYLKNKAENRLAQAQLRHNKRMEKAQKVLNKKIKEHQHEEHVHDHTCQHS